MNAITQHVTMTSLGLVDLINDHRKGQAEAAGQSFPSKGFAKLEHKDFLEKVPVVLGNRSAEFSADLPDAYGRARRGYRFPKRESCLMAMSYSYELQAAVYDRMTALESQAQNANALPQDYIQALEHLLASKKSEQAAIEQRDQAIATKAEIGNRREATAMATASAAVRKANQLRNELGKGCLQATITAVEIAAGRQLGTQGFRPLKRWCDERGISAAYVQDTRFGRVRAWPADAWLAVYKIDLASLFDTEVVA